MVVRTEWAILGFVVRFEVHFSMVICGVGVLIFHEIGEAIAPYDMGRAWRTYVLKNYVF